MSLDQELSRAEVKVCFDGVVPRELRAGRDEAADRLLYARWLGPGPVRRLAVERGRIQLDSEKRDGCVSYAVNLYEGGSMDAAVRRVGRDIVVSPNVWLWRPERRTPSLKASLTMNLPSGVSALLPWPHSAGRFQLDAEAFRFDSYAAIGHFVPLRSDAQGVAIEAALLDGALALDGPAVLRWLRSAVDLAAQSDGRFPRQRLAAIIVPSAAQDEPVAFGMVARGGSASVLLLVSATAQEAALASDWVLPHELSHLLLPFVERQHAWLSEGLATYYQEVLRARAGATSERAALYAMAASFRSAQAESSTQRSLVAESARMRHSHNYRTVYWGGAAFWLNVDVELRRRSHGHVSVDSVLSLLRSQETEHEVWTAEALIAKLDMLAGMPVFSEAFALAGSEPFPAFEPTLLALGVRGSGGSLTLDDAAELAALRHQLFALSGQAR